MFQDNVIYYDSKANGSTVCLVCMDGSDGATPPAFAVKGHNLLFAEGTTQSAAVRRYAYAGTDRYAKPIFNDFANGDLTLHATSPGKGNSSTGGDPGIAYNSYLRQSVMKHVLMLPTFTQHTSSRTSVTFTNLTPGRDYLIHVYMPDGQLSGDERVLIDGTHRFTYNYAGGFYVNAVAGGPQRWFPAYRHRATNSSMTISWARSGYFGQVRLYALPTADEAYTWMTASSTEILAAPSNLRVVSE